jgi:hypothetical protein
VTSAFGADVLTLNQDGTYTYSMVARLRTLHARTRCGKIAGVLYAP